MEDVDALAFEAGEAGPDRTGDDDDPDRSPEASPWTDA
jgi:hypothetical protein